MDNFIKSKLCKVFLLNFIRTFKRELLVRTCGKITRILLLLVYMVYILPIINIIWSIWV